MSVEKMSAEEVNKTMGGQIVKAQAAPLAMAGRQGFEDQAAEAGDLAIPRVKLLQSLSPEVTDGSLGVKPGDILLTTSQEKVGGADKALRVVPICTWKLWQEWEGTGANAKLLWQSRNPQDARVIAKSRWGANGEKPEAQESRNFLVLIHGSALPAVLTFSKTNFQIGRALYTAMFSKGGNMFDHAYEIGSKKVEGPKGTYHVFTWKNAGVASEDEQVVAAEFFTQFSGIKDMVHATEQE